MCMYRSSASRRGRLEECALLDLPPIRARELLWVVQQQRGKFTGLFGGTVCWKGNPAIGQSHASRYVQPFVCRSRLLVSRPFCRRDSATRYVQRLQLDRPWHQAHA
jgi:hypothetical protein